MFYTDERMYGLYFRPDVNVCERRSTEPAAMITHRLLFDVSLDNRKRKNKKNLRVRVT